jgi:hypothetical protein
MDAMQLASNIEVTWCPGLHMVLLIQVNASDIADASRRSRREGGFGTSHCRGSTGNPALGEGAVTAAPAVMQVKPCVGGNVLAVLAAIAAVEHVYQRGTGAADTVAGSYCAHRCHVPKHVSSSPDQRRINCSGLLAVHLRLAYPLLSSQSHFTHVW